MFLLPCWLVLLKGSNVCHAWVTFSAWDKICQEFDKRGFHIRWATVAARNVGVQAWKCFRPATASDGSKIFLSGAAGKILPIRLQARLGQNFFQVDMIVPAAAMSGSSAKVFKDSAYFQTTTLCLLIVILKFRHESTLVGHKAIDRGSDSHPVQANLELLGASALAPVADWCTRRKHRQRLNACGNIVIPKVAALAMNILGTREQCST